MGNGHPDSSWPEHLTGGDADALGDAFEKLRPRLRGWVSVRLGHKLREALSVDDVLQETFVRALHSVHHFRGRSEEALLRWLGAIAENFIRKAAAREQRASEFCLVRDPPAPGSSPSHELRKEERFERLQDSIHGLTPDQQRALCLVRLEGLKIKEAAARMGKTPGAVKLLLFRALRELRRRLKPTDSVHLPDRRIVIEDPADER